MTSGEPEGNLQHLLLNVFNKLMPDGSSHSKHSPYVYGVCKANVYAIQVGKDWDKFNPLIAKLEED